MEEWEHRLFEILKLAEKLFSTTTHSEMVDAILQRASTVLDCRVCLISLQKGKLIIENGVPFCGHGIGETVSQKKGEKFLKGVITDGHIVTVSDPLDDKRIDYLRPLVERLHISSIIFSPLHCAKGENIGVLVFDALRGKKFSREDAKFVKMISHVAALAIQRETREQKEKLEILRNERMVTLGVSSAAMSHTVRNVLTPIGGLALRIVKLLPADDSKQIDSKDIEALRRYAGAIYSDVKKLEKITYGVLNYSKPEVHLQKCNLNLLLAEEIGKMKMVYKDIAFKSKFDDRLSLVNFMVDECRFLCCIDDLIRNAIEARATSIFLRTKLSKLACTISIIDNGDGIDPQIIDDVFAPFMTSKINGNGLGLANVKAVVEAHNGEITVKSEGGRTVFSIKISLPSLNPVH